MTTPIKKPHLIFLFAIPVLLLIGILSWDTVLDINVHDTYFVIAHLHIAILLSVVFGLLGLGYWIVLKVGGKLSKVLTLVHMVFTIGGVLGLYLLPVFSFTSESTSNFPQYDDLVIKNIMTVCVLVIMVCAQLLYLANVTIGVFGKRKNQVSP